MKLKTVAAALAAAGLLSAGVAGLSYTDFSFLEHAHAAAATEAPAQVQPGVQAAALPDFSGIVQRYGPAVVNISVTQKAQTTAAPQMPDFGDNDDPMSQFFRRFMPQIPQGGQPMHGLGSGFIISPDGLILTNAHVVDGASEVDVKLTDRREFRAKVLGVDKASDIAVIKIDAKDLPIVKLGNPDDTKVGQWVLAIGSPFGLENTVTAGIVSAKYRALPGDTYVPFIQTDVAVNPGNSGGPLFNLNGEVVGINSQIFSRSGGYQGLSFAIPIDVAVKVEKQLVATGKVERGRIGVTIQQVNQALANSFGLKKPEGAIVSSVQDGSPAQKAGLQPGDVILKLNGSPIERSTDLPAKVADLKPGTPATLEVWRKGDTKNVDITIGAMKGEQVAVAGNSSEPQGRLGVAVRPLNPEEQKEAGVKGGLVVEQASGAAADAGIHQGDVILAINDTPVKSVAQLRALVSKADKTVALLVQRGDATIFVPVQLG